MKPFFLSLILSSLLLIACDSKPMARSPSGSAQSNSTYDNQVERFEAQLKKGDEHIAKIREQARRYDAILDKWEEQATRFDRILGRLEKLLDDRDKPQQQEHKQTGG